MALPTTRFLFDLSLWSRSSVEQIRKRCICSQSTVFAGMNAASDDQKFKLVTVNNKQRIAMNGNTSLGLNVYRSGDNPCTLYTLLNNDNDSQVSIEACSEGVSDCYYIYLTAHGKSVYTLTAPTNLTSTSARVTWKPYTGSPEQIWKIKTSHTANMYSGHGRYLPSRQDSTVTPFIWPCYKKTGARGYNPSTPHYGIDRDSYYQCSDQRNAPGDPIYPICAGTVVKVYEKHADFGNSVWINSKAIPNTTAITTGAYIRHLYMHFNSKPLVSVGRSSDHRHVVRIHGYNRKLYRCTSALWDTSKEYCIHIFRWVYNKRILRP